jgi:branched-chain amino acid transport system permease protein
MKMRKKLGYSFACCAALALVLGWPLVGASPFMFSLCTMLALNMIGAVSLHLIIRTGHVSLGHAAFMGIGSYTCVLTVMKLGVPPVVGLGLGVVASALVAAVIGPIVLRLTGKYFVLVTFLLGEITRQILSDWVSLTGGANGISGIPPIAPSLASPIAMYYVIVVITALCVAFSAALLRSETGRAIDSVAEAPNLAESSGVPVAALKIRVFVLACAMVGLQGALLAFYLQYVDPSTFGMSASLNFVVMNVIGGMHSIVGPLLGAAFIVGLPELLRGYVDAQQIIFGFILIVVMASLTGGMVELYEKLRSRLRSLRRGAPNGRADVATLTKGGAA